MAYFFIIAAFAQNNSSALVCLLYYANLVHTDLNCVFQLVLLDFILHYTLMNTVSEFLSS